MARFVISAYVLIIVFASTSSSPQADTKTINSINTEPRIVGETKATPNEFPYQVAIFAKGTATLRCGGALIAEKFVLTSAYCATLGNASDIEVMVGNIKLSRDAPSQLVEVKRIFIHNNYDLDGRKNDVALLQLSHNLLIRQPSVDVIALNGSPARVGEQCTFTGWGSDTWNGAVSDILEKVNLTTVNLADCRAQLGQYIQNNQICAADKEASNACFLDEGSPLVCKGELTGVLSHSVSCGKQNKPSVYTDVASHKIWIQQAINSTAALTIMSYVRILAMLTALAPLWSCRT